MYKDIIINKFLFNSWEDIFAPLGIINHMVIYDLDNYKQKDYIADVNNDNLENDLDIIIVVTKLEND